MCDFVLIADTTFLMFCNAADPVFRYDGPEPGVE